MTTDQKPKDLVKIEITDAEILQCSNPRHAMMTGLALKGADITTGTVVAIYDADKGLTRFIWKRNPKGIEVHEVGK